MRGRRIKTKILYSLFSYRFVLLSHTLFPLLFWIDLIYLGAIIVPANSNDKDTLKRGKFLQIEKLLCLAKPVLLL